jgi:hypothetical protein
VAATPEPESTPKDDLPGFDEEIAPDPEPPKLYRPKRPDAGEVKKPARTFHLSPFDEDEYDIPTFLRRQAD